MIMFGSFLRASWLVLAPPKFTRPSGADIVMESITRFDVVIECNRDVSAPG